MEIDVSFGLDDKKFKKNIKSLFFLSYGLVLISWDGYKKFEKKYIGDFFSDTINWKRVGKAIFICFSPILTLMILSNL